jgi:hypothetical protein
MSTVHQFSEVLRACLQNGELVEQFDRLRGTNIARRGSPMELVIDDASGRTRDDLDKFTAFVARLYQSLGER